MNWPHEILIATFLRRYKRFFADFEWIDTDGSKIQDTAHVPNTGSLMSCLSEGSKCLVSKNSDPNRKLKYTLEAIMVNSEWVGVNTSWPNKLAVQAFHDRRFKHWLGFSHIQAEATISDSTRFDLVLWKGEPFKKWQKAEMDHLETNRDQVHFVEIKNVTLFRNGIAQFPDAVTERGQKHLMELTSLAKQGISAEIIFWAQRTDFKDFRAAEDIDPIYAKKLTAAQAAGVRVTVVQTHLGLKGLTFSTYSSNQSSSNCG